MGVPGIAHTQVISHIVCYYILFLQKHVDVILFFK